MILAVKKMQFPFSTESDLGVTVVSDYVDPTGTMQETETPIEHVLADKPVLQRMVRTGSRFEISPADMAEIKEKELIVWPVTEQLFNVRD